MTQISLSITNNGTPRQFLPSEVRQYEAHSTTNEKFLPQMFNL